MKYQNSLAVLLALFESSEAIKIDREPLLTWAPRAHKAAFKMNYGVPNFGVDSEVSRTLESMTQQEKEMNHNWQGPPKSPPKAPPRNYFVPNFGVDDDVRSTQYEVKKAEETLGEWKVPSKYERAKQDPRDYFVPHFGQDEDVKQTLATIATTEGRMGKWNIDLTKAKGPGISNPPNFGIDSDINDSLEHLNEQESLHGKWNYPEDAWYVQRDPLLTWAPTPKKGAYPMNYGVPSFGTDSDVNDSQTHEKNAAAGAGHEWNPQKDEDGKFILPSAAIEFKLAQSINKKI